MSRRTHTHTHTQLGVILYSHTRLITGQQRRPCLLSDSSLLFIYLPLYCLLYTHTHAHANNTHACIQLCLLQVNMSDEALFREMINRVISRSSQFVYRPLYICQGAMFSDLVTHSHTQQYTHTPTHTHAHTQLGVTLYSHTRLITGQQRRPCLLSDFSFLFIYLPLYCLLYTHTRQQHTHTHTHTHICRWREMIYHACTHPCAAHGL
jgi:hypothetical protein